MSSPTIHSHARRGPWRTAVGTLALLPAALAVVSGCEQRRGGASSGSREGAAIERPDIILIVVDTLRRDRLGVYGHEGRSLSPAVDAFAADAIRYDHAYAQAPWTTPSVSSMLTSRYPDALGIRERYSAVPEDVLLLPEILQEAGYETGAVVANLFCSKRWGFDQGFDFFDESTATGFEHVTSADVTDRAIEFLDRPREGPLFLWAHYFDPHFLYCLHEEFASPSGYRGKIRDDMAYQHLTKLREEGLSAADVDELRRRYDSEVAYTDRQVGRLRDHLRLRGVYEDAIVIFTSDHGEAFLEHDVLGHGRGLHQELVHVPLLLKTPGGGGGVVEDVVELVDLVPTVLDRLDLPEPDVDLAGRSLPTTRAGTGEEPRPAFFTTERGGSARGVVSGAFKLIERGERRELYDLRSDPAERDNLASARPVLVDSLGAMLDDWAERVRAEQIDALRLDLTESERERLDALGYVR